MLETRLEKLARQMKVLSYACSFNKDHDSIISLLLREVTTQ